MAALLEVLSLLTIKDYDSLGLFMVVGLLTSYFTKNMTMVLISAMAFTNCRVCSNLLIRSNIIEGVTGSPPKSEVGTSVDQQIRRRRMMLREILK